MTCRPSLLNNQETTAFTNLLHNFDNVKGKKSHDQSKSDQKWCVANNGVSVILIRVKYKKDFRQRVPFMYLAYSFLFF